MPCMGWEQGLGIPCLGLWRDRSIGRCRSGLVLACSTHCLACAFAVGVSSARLFAHPEAMECGLAWLPPSLHLHQSQDPPNAGNCI